MLVESDTPEIADVDFNCAWGLALIDDEIDDVVAALPVAEVDKGVVVEVLDGEHDTCCSVDFVGGVSGVVVEACC